MSEVKVFGIGSSQAIAKSVCQKIGLELSSLEEEKFPDGELKICPKEQVAGADVFVFHSLGGDTDRTINDRLCELYFFLSTLRDLGAKRINAIIPYLAYARSDQRQRALDSVINRYVAQMLEGSGVHRVVTLDVHNISAFENSFRCPTTNLEASELFCQYLFSKIPKGISPVILSPDIGAIKRAEQFRKLLEIKLNTPVESAFLEKFRVKDKLTGHKLIGQVEGRMVLIIDDMISTGATILRALNACQKAGAESIKVFATHGVFSKNQNELLNSPLLDELIVTDSHPGLKSLSSFQKLTVLPCASLFANLIRMEGGYENISVRRRNDRTGD